MGAGEGEGEGHQTDAESRQGGCSWTWMKLPIESWLKFGSSLRFDTRGGELERIARPD